MARADPGPGPRPGRRAGTGHVPDVRLRSAHRRAAWGAPALHRPDTVAGRAEPRRHRPDPAAPRPCGAARAGYRTVAGARRRPAGRADVRRLAAPACAYRDGPPLLPGGHRGGLRRRAGGGVRAVGAVLHRRRRRARPAHHHDRRCAAGPDRGRYAAHLPGARGPDAGRGGAGYAGGRGGLVRRRGTGRRPGWCVPRRPAGARGTAGARRAHRLHPGAAGRADRPAGRRAAGRGDQGERGRTPGPPRGSIRRSGAASRSTTWSRTSVHGPADPPRTWSATGAPSPGAWAATARSPPRAR